ncbi:peptide deformylase [Desulfosarcina cetonica]|uniref:peptide deformylase n=1 Tax=Desulfosarcina cetonica TaxID=90730 RepID=UPI0006D11E12|nr:peptide deformylase [Desulfosarcina cetonica]VTR65118.1 peptide deformylase [Desulfosarcina cetonica]
MTVLDILTYPDKFLKQKTVPIENIDGAFQEVIEKMASTMYAAPGIGLAAPQVGIGRSFLVYDIANQEDGHDLHVLVNPRIIEQAGEIISENEGCLSVPDFRADVKRAEQILVEAVDRDGNPLRFEAIGMRAVVIQHEMDHLDGTLFIDRISALKRQMYKRRVMKELKQR